MKNLLFIALIVLLVASCGGDGQIQKKLLRTQEVQTSIPGNYFVSNFVNGVAVYRDNTGMEFLVNRDGKLLTPNGYSIIRYFFTDNYAVFRNQDGLYGVMSTDGKIIIDPIYNSIGNDESDPFDVTHPLFKNGMTLVRLEGKSGLIDKTGKVVLMKRNEEINSTDSMKIAAVASQKALKTELTWIQGKNGNYGLMNRSGKMLTKFKYMYAEPFYHGVSVVRRKDPKGYHYYQLVNTKGKEITTYPYAAAYDLSHNSTTIVVQKSEWVRTGNGWAVKGPLIGLTTRGKEIVFPDGTQLGLCYNENLNTLMMNQRYGFVNEKGELVVECKYEFAYGFHNGSAWVRNPGSANWSILNLK